MPIHYRNPHQQDVLTTNERRKEESYFYLWSKKKHSWFLWFQPSCSKSFTKMESSIPLTLPKQVCIMFAEEKSVTHKSTNARRAFLCVTDKRGDCSTYFLPGPAVQSICQQYSIFSFLTLFQITDNGTTHYFTINLSCSQIFMPQ